MHRDVSECRTAARIKYSNAGIFASRFFLAKFVVANAIACNKYDTFDVKTEN